MTPSKKPPRIKRGKEAVLLFLAAFYFVIATNTQSGWLFLLSAFLLGLLAMSWLPPRRAARQAQLSREILGSPQRGVPLLVRLRVDHSGRGPLREVVVVEPANGWAAEEGDFRWVIPRLPAGQSVSTQYSVTPARRGEHKLIGTRLTFGAPFGLFTVSKAEPDSDSFLVYPKLITLSPRRQRTRLAGILTEFTSPRSKGDSRSLRSLREYQTGDDLRMVHWKSSAKSGGGTLLVREHHAPSRQVSLLVLDTSTRPSDPASVEGFEKSIMLAASLLWSAHRAGTKSSLLLLGDDGWQRLGRWEEQYMGLARIGQQEELSFAAWMAQAGDAVGQQLHGGHPVMLSSATRPDDLGLAGDWPGWPTATLLVTPPDQADKFGDYPLLPIDVEDGQLSEAVGHV